MKPNLFKSINIPLPKGENQKEDVKPASLEVNITKTPLDDLTTALFGSIFRLNWYHFCLNNHNEVSINGINIKLPFEKDPETGAMNIKINYHGGANDEIYTKQGDSNCKNLQIDKPIENITAIYRGPLQTAFDPSVKFTGGDQSGLDVKISQSYEINTDKSSFSFKNLWYEFIFKILIYVIGWMLIVVGFKESLQIFRKL